MKIYSCRQKQKNEGDGGDVGEFDENIFLSPEAEKRAEWGHPL